DVVDPWSVPDENQASAAYRGRHQAIMGLLGLAGVAPTRDDGSTDPGALARARQLLQGEDLAQVPRNLARAIVRNLDVDPDLTDVVSDLVVDVQGDPKQVRALSELLRTRGRTTG
ncbi:MAG: hypothetical protein JWM25_746, partial [Thermoleophilia bacterium]|nr:hypothetical protein [Thermoleophilia bacterium]